MNNIIGYLDYRDNISFDFLKNVMKKIFFKVSLNKVEEDKFEILVNNCIINDKRLVKLKRIIDNSNIKNIAISNKIIFDKNNLNSKNINVLDGKFLMRNIIDKILDYIYNFQNRDMILDELYITISNDKNKDIIIDLAKKFKYINIVTDKVRKLKRLERKLENDENIIYSISNNTKKSLKKAKMIVNFDYSSEFFQSFNLNRNAIIINLNSNKLDLKNSYNGIIIENIMLEYSNEKCSFNFGNFDNNIVYESYIFNKKYNEIKDHYISNRCEISHLIGNNGNIIDNELKKYNNA